MKLINKFLTIPLTAVAVAGMFSCSKKIDEAYKNPNADVRVPIESLLPGIIGNFVGSSSAAGSAYGLANDGLYVGRYVQFWATNTTGNQYDQMGGATGASDILGSVWAMHYYGHGSNLSRMIDWGIEEKKWDYVGVGYAIRAWGWLTLTNMYGESIMRQAFDPSRLVFEYDTQEDIYKEARRCAHLALNYLSRTGDGVSQANLAKGDAYFYNGDTEKWKKFTYSVLARSFNHLTNKSNYLTDFYADSVIEYGKKGIIQYTDDAAAKFLASGLSGTFNFFGPFRSNVGALRQSRFISDLMTGLNPRFNGVNDPRAPYLIRENTNGTYKGVRPNKGTDGLTTNDQPQNFWGGAFSSTAAPGTDATCRYIFRNGSPFPIITAAEVNFMIAEAYLRKGDQTNAKLYYQEGIRQNFRMLINTPDYHNSVPVAMQMNAGQIEPFITSVTPGPANNLTRSHIMLQKFIAMYGYGLVETWVDVRRYHYTDLDPDPSWGQQVYTGLTPPTGSDLFTNNNGKWVYRARPRYNSEYLYNIAALSAVGGLALDYHTKEQWFSQP